MSEDRKFKFENGRFVNRVSGEPIPDDEPVILFRARDKWSVDVLTFYLGCAQDDHHRQAIRDRINEFSAYRAAHPDRVKEPGVTRHIRLNSDEPAPVASADGEVAEVIAALRIGNGGGQGLLNQAADLLSRPLQAQGGGASALLAETREVLGAFAAVERAELYPDDTDRSKLAVRVGLIRRAADLYSKLGGA